MLEWNSALFNSRGGQTDGFTQLPRPPDRSTKTQTRGRTVPARVCPAVSQRASSFVELFVDFSVTQGCQSEYEAERSALIAVLRV